MTVMRHLRSPSFVAGAMALALTCCVGTSRPSRFYTLQQLHVGDDPGPTTTEATLAVGPVDLPDYVDRPQIVTRTGANELVIGDFDRWGGSLERQISGSLVATLRERLAPRQMAVVPWRSVILSGGTSYRVAVSVSRFDGSPGKSVVLEGTWELRMQSEGKEESLGVKGASVVEQIDGPGYDALVAGMQRAMVRLGQQMAEDIAATSQMARVHPAQGDAPGRVVCAEGRALVR